jgi:hypothetical protein
MKTFKTASATTAAAMTALTLVLLSGCGDKNAPGSVGDPVETGGEIITSRFLSDYSGLFEDESRQTISFSANAAFSHRIERDYQDRDSGRTFRCALQISGIVREVAVRNSESRARAQGYANLVIKSEQTTVDISTSGGIVLNPRDCQGIVNQHRALLPKIASIYAETVSLDRLRLHTSGSLEGTRTDGERPVDTQDENYVRIN